MYTKQLKPVESVPDNILEELKNNYSKAGGWEEPDEVVKKFYLNFISNFRLSA